MRYKKRKEKKIVGLVNGNFDLTKILHDVPGPDGFMGIDINAVQVSVFNAGI